MHLLYITFGENISNHIQAQFSICSFLAQVPKDLTIHIITDRPEYYNNLSKHVNVINVDEATLTEWKGEHDFFWRIKIKAIEMMCNRYKNEPIVYLDADTFLYADLNILKQKLQRGIACMHEDEGKLSSAKSKTEKKMWRQVQNKNYGNAQITETHSMWNAGVVATPNKKDGKDLSDALKICDEMCSQGVTRRLIEQFALSVALSENYGIERASDCIGHYWANKEGWNKIINELFLKSYFKSSRIEDVLAQMANFDYSIQPIKVRVKNTKIRLEKMLEKLFPSKGFSFIAKRDQ